MASRQDQTLYSVFCAKIRIFFMNECCPTWFSVWTLWFSLQSTDCFCLTDFHYCAISRRGYLIGTQGKCISSLQIKIITLIASRKMGNLDCKYEPTPEITSFKSVCISFHSANLCCSSFSQQFSLSSCKVKLWTCIGVCSKYLIRYSAPCRANAAESHMLQLVIALL